MHERKQIYKIKLRSGTTNCICHKSHSHQHKKLGDLAAIAGDPPPTVTAEVRCFRQANPLQMLAHVDEDFLQCYGAKAAPVAKEDYEQAWFETSVAAPLCLPCPQLVAEVPDLVPKRLQNNPLPPQW